MLGEGNGKGVSMAWEGREGKSMRVAESRSVCSWSKLKLLSVDVGMLEYVPV